jgi:hypothetical protein
MPKGSKPGERRGGRQKGTLNKLTVERQMRAIAGFKAAVVTGELPLDVMLRRMHGDTTITDRQFEAAVAAAPYIHPRMAVMAVQSVPELDPLEEARRAQQRNELIAALQVLAKAEPLVIDMEQHPQSEEPATPFA